MARDGDGSDGDTPPNSINGHAEEDESMIVEDIELDVEEDDTDNDNDNESAEDLAVTLDGASDDSDGDSQANGSYSPKYSVYSPTTPVANDSGTTTAANGAVSLGAGSETVLSLDSILRRGLPSVPSNAEVVRMPDPEDSGDDADLEEAIARSLDEACAAFDTTDEYHEGANSETSPDFTRRSPAGYELWAPTPKRAKFSSAIDLSDGPSGASSKSSRYFIPKSPRSALPGNSAANEKDLTNCALYMCQKKPADLVCSGCYSVVYCSSEHQLMHWAEHEVSCQHFALRRSPQLAYQGPILVTRERQCKPGSINAINFATPAKRFQVVALVQIPAQEKVLDEIPVMVAPWPRISHFQAQDFSTNREIKLKSATCFGCCSALNTSPFNCVKCNLPMCSSACALRESHVANECQIIVKRQSTSTGNPFHRDQRTFILEHSDQDVEYLYEDVMMCRLILLYMREEGKKLGYVATGATKGWTAETRKWTSLLKTWKCEDGRRLKESVRGEYTYKHLEKLFPLSFFLTNEKTAVWKLFCILETNAFKYQREFKRYNVLCNVLPLAHHSCQPNTHTFLEESDAGDLVVRAVSTRRIEKGESITISYVPLFYSFMERRLLILDEHMFWCRCSRCCDRNDCKLFTASLKCACGNGHITPPKELLEEEPGPKPDVTDIDRDEVTSAQSEYFDSLSSPKYNWRCSKQVGDVNPFYGGSSSKSDNGKHEVLSTSQVFRELSWQEENCARFLDHPASTAEYVRSLSRQVRIHNSHTITLKLMESILRGDIFDISNPRGLKLKELNLVSSAKKKMEAFMKALNPFFAFEGYALEALAEIKVEYDARMRSVISGGQIVSVPPSNANHSAAASAAGSGSVATSIAARTSALRRYTQYADALRSFV